MNKSLNVHIEVCEKEHVKTIIDGINDYNFRQVPALTEIWTPLEFIAKNSDGLAIGGVLGGIDCYNGLEINILWVKEEHREKDTFDFQAEGFYLKNGYHIIGEIKDYPKKHKRIYLAKKLA